MITSQYKTGVLILIARIKNYNSQIGEYVSHDVGPDNEFIIQLTNGTLKVPPEVPHSQEVFPALVPEAWIIEIEKTYVKSIVPVQIIKPKSTWRVILSFLS